MDDESPPTAGRVHRRVLLASTYIDDLTARETVDAIFDSLDRAMGGWLITYNLDILRRACVDAAFERQSRAATLRVADGMPLLWAASLQGTPLAERVAGSDLVYDIAAAAAARGRSIFLLGGNPADVCDRAVVRLKQLYPELEIAGAHSPPVGFLDDTTERTLVGKLIADADPDLVLIGLPPNLQAAVHEHYGQDTHSPTWWLGVGVTFSFVTGDIARAPRWMQRCGLEWAHRLAHEPRRLGRRYLIEGPPFVVRLLGGAALRRIRRDGSRVEVLRGPFPAAPDTH